MDGGSGVAAAVHRDVTLPAPAPGPGPLQLPAPTNTNTCCSSHYTAISSCLGSVHSPLVSTAIILSYDPTKVSDFNLDSVKINNRWFHLVLVQQ